MIVGILILLLTAVISIALINKFDKQYAFFDKTTMMYVYGMHLLMSILYFIHATFNRSDSLHYFWKIETNYRGASWGIHYGTSTYFIEWLGYPFIKYMGFSYEAMMALFSFFGFLGFIYFYLFFKENIRFRHKLFNLDLITIIFLLPNLHFWSASFGKGSIILMGLGMFMYGLTKPFKRLVLLVIGGVIIYHVRPHIMFVILVSVLIGFTFSTKGIGVATRLLLIAAAAISFIFIYQDVLSLVGIEQGEELSEGLDLTHRARELSKATSGVNITQYSLPMQIFTFLYRPLFFDAPGALGIFVSIENVFYLFITFKILSLQGIRFVLAGNFLVKSAFLSFVTVSIALAQISGNLGIAIRQKSQVMLLFLFVIVAFMDHKKIKEYKRFLLTKKRRQRLKQAAATQKEHLNSR